MRRLSFGTMLVLGWLAAGVAAAQESVPASALTAVAAVRSGAHVGDQLATEGLGGAAVAIAPGVALSVREAFPATALLDAAELAVGGTVRVALPGGGSRVATIERLGRSTAVVLRLDTTGMTLLPLADPSAMPIGTPVWMIGNSTSALIDDGAASVSRGILSGRYRLDGGPAARGRGGRQLSTWTGAVMELDAAINDGDQGGAVIDQRGRLLGLATAAVARDRRLGCAIPLDALLADAELRFALETATPDAMAPAADPPGLALVAFARVQGLGNPDAVPRPTRTPDQVPAYERERLARWWDAYHHQQQVQWTDAPAPALIIDAAEGLVLTAASHLRGQDPQHLTGILLREGNTAVPVTVLAVDRPLDLLLLRVAEASALPLTTPAAVIVPRHLRTSEAVSIIARHRSDAPPSRTAGTVAAAHRRLSQSAVGFAQLDARSNYGSLGAAVIDAQGAVVGLTVLAGPAMPWLINSGVTIAVDGDTIAGALAALRRGESRDSLPVLGLGVTLEADDGLLLIKAVAAGTGAAAAGIIPGDVLLRVADQPVSSHQTVSRILLRHRAGDAVIVTVRRDGREQQLRVVLQEFGP